MMYDISVYTKNTKSNKHLTETGGLDSFSHGTFDPANAFKGFLPDNLRNLTDDQILKLETEGKLTLSFETIETILIKKKNE